MTPSVKSPLRLFVLALALEGWAVPSLALQELEAVEGRSILVKVSAKEPSRLSVEGQPIRAATADEAAVTIHRDEKDPQGHIFVRPKDPSRHVTVFISTDKGAYSLLLKPEDIPAETIVLRDRSRRDPPKVEQAGSRARAIKGLILTMARDETPSDLEVREVGKEYALWQEVQFSLLRSYLGQAFVGELWRLANVSTARVSLLEQELYRDGVVAVAMDHMNLEPGQATNVYLVRERRGDE